MFESPERCQLARNFLMPLGGEIGLDDDSKCSIKSKEYDSIQIVFQPHWIGSPSAEFVAREIARRFDVVSIGDFDGWFSDENWQEDSDNPLNCSNRYGENYGSWVEWLKNYKPEWNKWVYASRNYGDNDKADWFLESLRKVESFVVEKFCELDIKEKQCQL